MKIFTGENKAELIPDPAAIMEDTNGVTPLNALRWATTAGGEAAYKAKDELTPICFGAELYDTTIIIDASYNMNPVGFMLVNALEVLRQAISGDPNEIDVMHTNSFGVIRHSSLHAVSVSDIRYHGKMAGLQFALNNAKYDDIIFITGGLSAMGPVVVPEEKNLLVWDVSGSVADYSAYAHKTVSNRDPIIAVKEILLYHTTTEQMTTPILDSSFLVIDDTAGGNYSDMLPHPDWYITHQWTTNMLAEFSDLSIEQIARLRRMAINNIFNKDNLDDQLTAMRSLYPYVR